MTKLLVVCVTGFALAGCAQMMGSEKSAPEMKARAMSASTIGCTGACNVPVTVTSDGRSCSAAVADSISVTPSAQPTIIKWQIAGASGFRFATPDGIKFDKGNAPPTSVMQNGQGGGTVVTINDAHTGPATRGHFPYSVYITNGSISCKIDPSVDNN